MGDDSTTHVQSLTAVSQNWLSQREQKLSWYFSFKWTKTKLKGKSFLISVDDSTRHMQSLTAKFLKCKRVIDSKGFNDSLSYELKLNWKVNLSWYLWMTQSDTCNHWQQSTVFLDSCGLLNHMCNHWQKINWVLWSKGFHDSFPYELKLKFK